MTAVDSGGHLHRPGAQDYASGSVLGHVMERVAELRTTLASQGVVTWPPTLALGTFERVGSNWFLDTERVPGHHHNEPFRQQLHPTSCFSPLTRHPASVEELDALALHPFALHWLTAFAATKYAPVGQVIKETNLFFAANGFLRLFPDAEVVVLCRSPVGIASSFVRGNLFDRWGYAERYGQMREICQRPERLDLRYIVPDDQSSKLQKLARLMVLNAVLLSAAIGARPHTTLAYETRFGAQQRIAVGASCPRYREPSVDDTFSTRRPLARLTSHLATVDAHELRREVKRSLYSARDAFDARAIDRAERWLADDTRNTAAPSAPSPAQRRPPSQPAPAHEPRYVTAPPSGLLWRTTLVTNREVCAFLDRIGRLGVPNVLDGVHLFVNETMPHERGGRIRRSSPTGAYVVSAGSEDHPAYWITWLGAAAIAAHLGARLPLRHEIETLARLHEGVLGEVNADHRVGDVTPVIEPDKGAEVIHHRLGNLQVWCADGPPTPLGAVHWKYFYGVAWDTPATAAELWALKARHITGCSRGIGVRLVRDATTTAARTTDEQLAHRLRLALATWQPRLPLDAQDSALVRAVSG